MNSIPQSYYYLFVDESDLKYSFLHLYGNILALLCKVLILVTNFIFFNINLKFFELLVRSYDVAEDVSRNVLQLQHLIFASLL